MKGIEENYDHVDNFFLSSLILLIMKNYQKLYQDRKVAANLKDDQPMPKYWRTFLKALIQINE